MIPQEMSVKHDPENAHFGDCARACIASMLELQPYSVPHFYRDGNGENGHARMQEFLGRHGLCYVQIPLQSKAENGEKVDLKRALEIGGYWTDDLIHYMLGGNSVHGCGHFVVAKSDRIVHNPGAAKLIGPQDDGFWWFGIFAKTL